MGALYGNRDASVIENAGEEQQHVAAEGHKPSEGGQASEERRLEAPREATDAFAAAIFNANAAVPTETDAASEVPRKKTNTLAATIANANAAALEVTGEEDHDGVEEKKKHKKKKSKKHDETEEERLERKERRKQEKKERKKEKKKRRESI